MSNISKSKQGYKKIKWLFGKEIEIPEEWELKRLKEVAKVKGGKRLPFGASFSEIKTTHPYLRVVDFKNNIIDEKNLKYISDEIFEEIKNYTVSSDNVYISIAGTIGLSGLIPNHLNGSNLTENAAKIIITENIIKNYLSILLNFELIQNQIRSYLGITSQPKLALFRIEKLELLLPSVNEQQKIASILSGVDALIESTQHIIEKTERLKKSLMQKLLTRGIGHTKFKKIKWLFGKEIEIPEKWKIYTIDNLIRNKKDVKTGPFGSNLKKETFVLNGCKVYGQENVIPNNFLIGNYYISQEHFDKLKEYEIKPNDILISLVGTHSKISLVPMGIKKGIINPRLLRIRFNTSKAIPNFMKILLNFNFTELQIKKFAHGLTMEIINTAVLRKIVFFIPNIDEQQKIASILSGVDAYIQKNQQYKERLEKLKKGLMQKLLTGQIRVKV